MQFALREVLLAAIQEFAIRSRATITDQVGHLAFRMRRARITCVVAAIQKDQLVRRTAIAFQVGTERAGRAAFHIRCFERIIQILKRYVTAATVQKDTRGGWTTFAFQVSTPWVCQALAVLPLAAIQILAISLLQKGLDTVRHGSGVESTKFSSSMLTVGQHVPANPLSAHFG
eukprot:scaffold1984_cov162-Amphora_coffeaeformis.AAC.10